MRPFFLFTLLALLTGCGPSPNQIVKNYRPRIEALRTKVQQLASKMPGEVHDQPVSARLEPRLHMVAGDPLTNTEVRMLEELSDSEANPPFDLNLSEQWHACFYWVTHDLHSTGDPAFMQQAFEQSLNTRYLVVHRVKDLQQPLAVDDDRFTPGSARIEGVVIDLQSEEVVATYVVEAHTSDMVNFAVRSDESRRNGLQRFADSSLWQDARNKIQEKLANLTYGVVQFDRNGPQHDVPPPAALSSPAAAPPTAAAPASTAPPPPLKIDKARQTYLRDLTPVVKHVHEEQEHQLLRDFSVQGVKYQHGLYTHPPGPQLPARVTFLLNKQYQRLAGGAGQSDGLPSRSRSPLTFRILGDGRELWASARISNHGDASHFDIDVSSVDQLELRVDCPGDHSFAWGAWFDPVLTR